MDCAKFEQNTAANRRLRAVRKSLDKSLILENKKVGISLNPKTGMITSLQNKLTRETYQDTDDSFAVEAVEFQLKSPDMQLESIERQNDCLRIKYHHAKMKIEVLYTLGKENHFVEKRMTLVCGCE